MEKTVKKARAENLKPWKPGQRGNPRGRPKNDLSRGKVKEVHEVTGRDGGPIEYRHLTDAELDERIKQLERELGLTQIGGSANES